MKWLCQMAQTCWPRKWRLRWNSTSHTSPLFVILFYIPYTIHSTNNLLKDESYFLKIYILNFITLEEMKRSLLHQGKDVKRQGWKPRSWNKGVSLLGYCSCPSTTKHQIYKHNFCTVNSCACTYMSINQYFFSHSSVVQILKAVCTGLVFKSKKLYKF